VTTLQQVEDSNRTPSVREGRKGREGREELFPLFLLSPLFFIN
jgi:hypothetical protein